MPTIQSIEDLIQVLKEHPEWREPLLQALLSEEFLRLPAEFRIFRAETEGRLTALENLFGSLDRRGARVDCSGA